MFHSDFVGGPPAGAKTWKTSKGEVVWVVSADNKKITMSNGKVLARRTADTVENIVELNCKLSALDMDEDDDM